MEHNAFENAEVGVDAAQRNIVDINLDFGVARFEFGFEVLANAFDIASEAELDLLHLPKGRGRQIELLVFYLKRLKL